MDIYFASGEAAWRQFAEALAEFWVRNPLDLAMPRSATAMGAVA